MQVAETEYEISYEQVQVRDIAEEYLRIQENTEYLTHIVRHQPGRRREPFTLDVANVDLKSFFNIIVQSSYLLYTCSLRKTSLLFSNSLFVIMGKDNLMEVMQEYLLRGELERIEPVKRKVIQQNFTEVNPAKSQYSYSQYVMSMIESLLMTINRYLQKNVEQAKRVLSDKDFKRQLGGLTQSLKMLSPKLQAGLTSKSLISCLEETEIFQTYSYLLKIVNCSIYQAIRKRGKFQETLQEIKRKEVLLAQRHALMIQENAPDSQCEIFIQNCIEDLLKLFHKVGFISIEVSYNSNSSDSKKGVKIGSRETSHMGERNSIWKIRVQKKKLRQFTPELIEDLLRGEPLQARQYQQDQDSKRSISLFIIEYFAQSNLLSVKYVSDVEINIENSDALMYHCNNMMLQWKNMSLEQVEREQSNNRKEKCIAFKVVTYFNLKDSPFINILLLLDLAMIYGKIAEPELSRKIVRLDDYNRFVLVAHKINHTSQLFIKKIRREYESKSRMEKYH